MFYKLDILENKPKYSFLPGEKFNGPSFLSVKYEATLYCNCTDEMYINITDAGKAS